MDECIALAAEVFENISVSGIGGEIVCLEGIGLQVVEFFDDRSQFVVADVFESTASDGFGAEAGGGDFLRP